MNLWQYYNGDLKYPDLTKHAYIKEVAKVSPKWAFDYVSKHGKDKELESIIAKDAYYSYQYSIDILQSKPFKLGEPAIAKNTEESYYYAKHILKGEFPLGEPAIAKDMDFSYEYTMLINRRFELGELQIAKNPYYSYRYAKIILNGPFKLGEPIMANYEQYASAYTQYVLKKDFYLDGKLICKYEG